MVDLDNYMQGNKPFTENDPHEVAVSNYEAKVQALKPDPKNKPENPQKHREMIRNGVMQSLRWVDTFEPNSNANATAHEIEKAKVAAAE